MLLFLISVAANAGKRILCTRRTQSATGGGLQPPTDPFKNQKKEIFSLLLSIIYNTLHPCVCQHARACDAAALGGSPARRLRGVGGM